MIPYCCVACGVELDPEDVVDFDDLCEDCYYEYDVVEGEGSE